MFTRVKTDSEIRSMRQSGRMLATVLQELKKSVQPGQTTKDLADIAAKELKALGGKPAFLGYPGMPGFPDFPDVLCVSVNDEVVHGIPSRSKIIQDGDIVSMDFGVIYEGMITDAAISHIAGKSRNSADEKLLRATEESMMAGIFEVIDGVKIGTIGASVQSVLERNKLGIIRDLVGHGVGHYLHEDPNIPNYGKKGKGESLQAGMTIAIEPMATLGTHQVFVDADGWTIRTRDGSRSAHFEHTVLITDEGSEILTKL